MAKDTFAPTVWTKDINGEPVERTSHSPSDDVAYEFDGWVRKPTKAPADKADGKSDSKK